MFPALSFWVRPQVARTTPGGPRPCLRRHKRKWDVREKYFSNFKVIYNVYKFKYFHSSTLTRHILAVTCDLFDSIRPHVQQHSAADDAASQLKQAVQRQRGYIRFTPPLSSILNILLELQPPATGVWVPVSRGQQTANWPAICSNCSSNTGAFWVLLPSSHL